MEDLYVELALLALLADAADEITDTIDVVGETYTGDHLDENEAEGLLPIGSNKISEPHSKHNCCAPIVSPDVALGPWGITQSF